MLTHRPSFSQSTTPTAARTMTRRFRLGALLASAALGATGLSAAPAAADVIPTDRPFAMENVYSGLVADVPDWSSATGTKIVQWPSNGGANQRWSAKPVLVNGVTLYMLKSRHSLLCLERDLTTQRIMVKQSPCLEGNGAQYWHFTRSFTTQGAHKIKNLATGSPLHVTSTAARANLTLGATPQIGKTTPLEPSVPTSAEWRLRF